MVRRITTLLVFLLLCLTAGAKGWYYQNLPSSEVRVDDYNCSFVEPRGYVWTGTKHGLERMEYGGETRWYHADGVQGSLPGDYIYNIVRDREGGIWVSTDAGAVKYRPQTDDFVPLHTDSGDILKAYSLLYSKRGVIYLGADDALYTYDKESGCAKVLQTLGFSKNYRVEEIYEIDGRLFLYNKEQGLSVYNPANGSVSIPDNRFAQANAFFLDSDGRFWCSEFNKGIECYDSSLNLIKTYTTENSAISSNVVNCFLERDGLIFIGSDGKGIDILDPATGKVETIGRDPDDFNSFPFSSVRELHLDAAKAIWVITNSIEMAILKESFLRTVSFAPIYDQLGHSSDNVRCVTGLPSNPSKFWVGTETSGVFEVDRTRSKTKSLALITPVKGTQGKNIESMTVIPDGRIMMSVKSEGVYFLNPSTGALSPFTAIKDPDFYYKTKYSKQPFEISVDNSGQVLLLCDVIYIWNPVTNEVRKHNIPSHVKGESLLPVSNGKGCYFHCERFLYFWDSEKGTHEVLADAGPDISIVSVTMDSTGTFWLATDKGIFSYTQGGDGLKSMETAQNIVAETVMADDYNRIWMGAGSSLYLYLPQLRNLMHFADNDGANWNKYNSNSWYKNSDFIYLGGVNGLLTIDPAISFQSTDVPEIVVEDLYIDDVRIPTTDKVVKLRPTYKTFELHFLVKEDNMFRNKKMKYIVDGPSDSRTIIKDETSLKFNQISSGVYTVSVSCNQQSGEWTEPVKLVTFRIMPLWYKSILFWLAAILLILAAALFFIINIRKSNKYELALAESKAEAKSNQDSVKFLLNVSHELKTPLTLIINPLSRLLLNKTKDDPEYQTLRNIYRQANRMSSLILTVLSAHKIKEGSATLNPQEEYLNDWIENIVETFDEEAENRGMKIVRKYAPNIERVPIDGQKLENVLTNMLINAFKHSPDNTVITVGTEPSPEDMMLRVYISDQGEGLNGVDMTKLFSRFYQGYAQQTGSGLGLAYANSIVELHKGTMGAFENPTGGSTFYFDIPGKTVSGEPVSSAPTSNSTIHKDISEAYVLVVDDDADLRRYIASELSFHCKRVSTASDGRQALDTIQNTPIDVVVSDVMMPVMDGFELCKTIKTSPSMKHIPVILLTAKIGADNIEKGLSLGADTYLPKPFEEKELINAINKALNKE